ncbi:flagellar basal body rod protein [Evansella tamaricis]|uniref:Flagellar basal body rod protein n=1 Tax=Evansella tamaricis TaxID=2069301 RepID=A0ABS6JBE6_9BACI|nr:flagellar basal body rod protein [Evansella tamaricis]MBU9710999.1 flagellar basal body rod protein [Evansella tamaricis]
MKKFIWFLLALIALFIILANLGPMVMLGFSVFLLYLIFKQFIKTESTVAKVLWVILGLFILGVAVSNIYAVIGIAALYFLYFIYKKWQSEKEVTFNKPESNDPFSNFEREWANLNK